MTQYYTFKTIPGKSKYRLPADVKTVKNVYSGKSMVNFSFIKENKEIELYSELSDQVIVRYCTI